MATPNEVLFQTLEDLGAQDFQVFKWFLEQKGVLDGLPSIPVSRLESADRVQTVDQIMAVYGLHCIRVTKTILAKMNLNQLALELSQFPFEPEEIAAQYQRRLQAKLREKFVKICERISKTGSTKAFSEVYTELYISPAQTRETQHEVQQIQTKTRTQPETTILCNDIFRGQTPRGGPIRAVVTKGVAGIGKTVLTQKFSLDWAEGRANQDIQLLFPFTFRELNVLRDTQFSLVGLLHHFFSESAGLCSFEHLQVVFIFDGLDECRLPLDFTRTRVLTETTESVSVDVLLVNLIRGTLLPSARLWITTRPAAANQIPAECISMVTEVRGFADPQKEQYFRKRFRDEQQATAVISHIRTSRSLYIICHIPVFCWIIATVIEKILKQTEGQELPRTLTNLYIHFLVVQLKQKNVKYDGKLEAASAWSPENKKMVESLGKLAFEELQKGNLIFYESDLSECGLDAAAASVYSGVLTDIFRDESGLYEDQVYCFVHLSVQEFLAALHVHLTYFSSGVNLLREEQSPTWFSEVFSRSPSLYQSAVDLALQSPNGHLDLFLRFLLGLSLPANQSLLSELVPKSIRRSQSSQDTAKYIKKRIKKCDSTERSLNLFHCLNELNDRSLVEQIQQSLSSGRLDSEQLSPAQWSALVFILLASETDLEEFDLKKYSPSEEALLKLLPVVRASHKALLSGCNLSQSSCGPLSSVLNSSSLGHLDLSDNLLQDSGVELLCSGLKSALCRLETLRLSGCRLSEQSGALLFPVLCSESSLKELDLSRNLLKNRGLELLCEGLRGPRCPLETLRLSCCGLTEGSGKFLCGVLRSESSRLRELDLRHNQLKDTGATQLIQELPHCTLHTLSLASCSLSEGSWEALSFALGSGTCVLKELDLSNNKLKDAGLKRICPGLGLDSGLEALRLNGCDLTERSGAALSSVLSCSSLRHLDLSNNQLQDSGLKSLCVGLQSAPCRLETLRLSGCKLTERSCGPLSSVLGLDCPRLKDLDLSNNDLQDSGLKALTSALETSALETSALETSALETSALETSALETSALETSALERPSCGLQRLRLENCNLSQGSCGPLSSVLSCSSLRHLDLSNNQLQDSGLKSLCVGLQSAPCRLETLSLSGCLVSGEGCASLASVLNSNPSHLRELDLSYNHPGDSGAELLRALQSDPRCRLDTLRMEHCGPLRLRPGLRKYLFELRPDLNSLHPNLRVSADLRTVTCVDEEQQCPPHQDRFDFWPQLLYSEPLIGRRYVELQSRGLVKVAVSYGSIRRKGQSAESKFGGNRSSWCLFCSDGYYSVWHDNRQLLRSQFEHRGPDQDSDTLGVYVDSEARSLSFYSVFSDRMVLLQSFSEAFTEPLFAGVRFWLLSPGASVTLRPQQ